MQRSLDDFLDGRLKIYQPKAGYRAGVDPVFLAAATPAVAGDQVLELGCGVGVASLCLLSRVAGISVVGVEKQEAYVELARENGQINELDFSPICADLNALPATVRDRQFDHVIANPPYFSAAAPKASDAGRAAGRREETPLADWFEAASKRLKPKGYFTLIQRTERLPEVLSLAPQKGLGSMKVQPLAPREGRDATLFLLQARKSGRADFVMHAPILLHNGREHLKDGESYTQNITDVLRHGAAFAFSD